MKHFLAVVIALSYLCLSTGFTLHEHYCMGKLISVSIAEPGDTHKCSACGMKKGSSEDGCCKDEFKVIKAKDDAVFSKVVFQQGEAFDAVLPSPVYNSPVEATVINKPDLDQPCRPHGPPLAGSVRLHARNSVFLI